MKKCVFSHYTFIYPDTYLKNHIVELDNKDKIIGVFPFVEEIEKTEFYSGLVIFIPEKETLTPEMNTYIIQKLSTRYFLSDKDVISDIHIFNYKI